MTGAAGRRPTLPVPALRAAVAREAAGLTLRRAAREIGISPNGLRNFLNGAAPRHRTRAKLEGWLARRGARASTPDLGRLIRLLDELTVDLSPEQAAALAQRVARLLLAAYAERRLPPPRWVRELAAHYRAHPGRGTP